MLACRMCRGTELSEIIDFGSMPPADQFLTRAQLHEPVVSYPLVLMSCDACGLFQLSYVVPPDILYRHDYPYESSTTQTGRRHWAEFARTTVDRFRLDANDLVVDIGSNVGVLLDAFKQRGTRVLGVDPASNIALLAERNGIRTLNEFFGLDVARQIIAEAGHASVITGTNVFAHVDDLDAFVRAVQVLLNERGVFIFEAPYLVNLVNSLEYDTIYHEHLSYLSVRPLIPFFKRFGMDVFDIEQRDIHGGSFRVFVARAGQNAVAPIVGELLRQEATMGLYEERLQRRFADQVRANRQDLLWLLRSLKHGGQRIVGVSAPAKGMTLLNYCRIGTETLDFVTEKSTLKIGRYTPGSNIPVLGDPELLVQTPHVALLLAWNFADEIMKNLGEFQGRGGKFIIPIPSPRIVDPAVVS